MSNRSHTGGGRGGALSFSCNAPGVVCTNDTLQITPRDTHVTIRAFIDNNFAECYWQDGRVAMTIPTPPTMEAGIALVNAPENGAGASGGTTAGGGTSGGYTGSGSSGGTIDVTSTNVWRVGGIWVEKSEVLLQQGGGQQGGGGGQGAVQERISKHDVSLPPPASPEPVSSNSPSNKPYSSTATPSSDSSSTTTLLNSGATVATHESDRFSMIPGATGQWTRWKNQPQAGIPWPRSTDLLGWEYLSGANPGYGGGDHVAGSADTWYVDELYILKIQCSEIFTLRYEKLHTET
jgi:hypothetical protein